MYLINMVAPGRSFLHVFTLAVRRHNGGVRRLLECVVCEFC
jgi:hypothetical protein